MTRSIKAVKLIELNKGIGLRGNIEAHTPYERYSLALLRQCV